MRPLIRNPKILFFLLFLFEKCIRLADKLVKGLEQRSFISEQYIMWVYKIQEILQIIIIIIRRSLNA
jgi:hypothetical protein